MPQNPFYTLIGNSSFLDNSVNFQIKFQNAGDQALVQSYEWYLDGILVINSSSQAFSAEVNCGSHLISVRLLYQGTWTGTQELSFQTCRTIVSIEISGSAQVDLNSNTVYTVICEFSDGTSEDVTSEYSFSSSAGGTFSGNTLTAAGGNGLIPPFGLTITATSGEETPLTKDISVVDADTTSMSILVVDLYNNATLNVIGLIDNSEVVESHVAAYTGNNFIPIGSAASGALILASDFINQAVLNWRFEFNLYKLKFQYPGTDQFRFYIKGRGSAAASLTGAYVVFSPQGVMTMANAPGTYAPSVNGGAQVVGQTNFTTNVVAGANGSYNEADLTTMLEFIYTVSENTVTYTS